MSSKNTKKETIFCKFCKKDVVPVTRMFNTKVCTKCNNVLSSDRGIDKAGM